MCICRIRYRGISFDNSIKRKFTFTLKRRRYSSVRQCMYYLKYEKKNATSLTGLCSFDLQFILVFVLCCSSFEEVSSKLSLNSYHFKYFFRFFFYSNFNCISLHPLQTRHRFHHRQRFGVFFFLHLIEWRNAFVNLAVVSRSYLGPERRIHAQIRA